MADSIHHPRSGGHLDVHIVSHTHWDREWYHPLGRFRQRLVALVDELLDRPPREGESFLLDGQGVVLDDYLAVRPERRAELAARLRSGALEAGPWYVLADELIPSGEALVRNLLAGRRALRALRAGSPRVLYCPDSFGHPAALPQLALGFGLDAVIAWRGYGSSRWPQGDAAWWEGPDGRRVLLLHLPPDGYEFGSALPPAADAARDRWRRMREVLGGRSSLGVILVHNGADHHALQPHHDEAVAALVEAARPDAAHPSTLDAYVAACREAATGTELPTVRGELRDSYGYAWTLQGTFGTRAAQKRTNARVERLLLRDAEPWAALARARGGASRRPLLEAAWRALLECHPHDTLCGCSIDAVARAADVRWEDARFQGEGIREDALHELVGHDVVAARTRREAWRPLLLVRNSAAWTRGGVAELVVDTFVADVPVGHAGEGSNVPVPDVLPGSGLALAHQVLAEEVVFDRTESPRHYPDNDMIVRRRVLAWVPAVPALGVRPMPFDERSPAPPAAVRVAPHRIANEHIALELLDGRLRLSAGARTIEDVIGFECREDVGDLYTPAIRRAAPQPRLVDASLACTGPLRASLRMRYEIPVPGDGAESEVEVEASLDAGAPFVRFAVNGVNFGLDQRLRIVLRTGVTDPDVWADAMFGSVRRVPLAVPEADAAREIPPLTQPLHRYVSLFGSRGGATVYSDGLGEYEAMADGGVAVTLVRSVGQLSLADLPERPGHAGWPVPTTEAQCIGPFVAELALYLHAGERDPHTVDAIERVADDALLPLGGTTLRSALASYPPMPGITLAGTGLALTTVKESEDGSATVVRCLNLLDEPTAGSIAFGWPVTAVVRARLDETPLDPVIVRGNSVNLEARPRELVTLLVR